jgi:tetratricopeptide (TPR) repeat protein
MSNLVYFRIIVGVLGIILGCGCASSAPIFVPYADRSQGLPATSEGLIHLADQLLSTLMSQKPPPLTRTDRGLAALEKAATLSDTDPFNLQWRLSRACYLMTEHMENENQRHSYALRGVKHAQEAAKHAPLRVEGHYFLALNTAKVLESTSNVRLIKSVVSAAEMARKRDQSYDDAGPLRILGKVYLMAPAWPVSVGSPEKAVEVLEKAVAIAPVPLNRIFLGEAYYHDDEYQLAEKNLRDALNDGRVNHLSDRWLQEAQDYLKRIGTGATADPKTNF